MTVDDYRSGLAKDVLATVDALREIVAAADNELTESIKWNAPNFAKGGVDRITLGLERRGGVRLVLHRGAAVRDATGFTFADPDGLAKWPAPDRGIVVFADEAAVRRRRHVVHDLCKRWLSVA